MSGAGKSTVANHLVGHDPLSPDEPPFRVSERVFESVRREVQPTKQWSSCGKTTSTVVNTAGFFDFRIGHDHIFDEFVQYIRENNLRIHLILFVLKKTRFTREENDMFSFFMAKFWKKHVAGCPKDISPISALVVTGCECDDTTTREAVVQEYKVESLKIEIASQMGIGIYSPHSERCFQYSPAVMPTTDGARSRHSQRSDCPS